MVSLPCTVNDEYAISGTGKKLYLFLKLLLHITGRIIEIINPVLKQNAWKRLLK
jgi:hypothetical protein